jgi:hypothetical protein
MKRLQNTKDVPGLELVRFVPDLFEHGGGDFLHDVIQNLLPVF